MGVSAELLEGVISNGAGAVTTKSIGPVEREGHKNPTVIEIENGLCNAVGLPSPGYLNMDDEFKAWKKLKAPLIASVYGSSIDEYVKITGYLRSYKPSFIELNISCPNKEDGMVFGTSAEMTKRLVKKVKAVSSIPVIAKLTPNCDDVVEIAKAAESAGADALCCFNTFGPEEIKVSGIPVLAYGKGGISGPRIRKNAVSLVKDVASNVKIPIIGTGGITYGKDAVEMLKAGATAVGIGSGVYFRGIDVFKKVNDEIKEIMKKERCDSLKGLIGGAP